jgi:hypothetical protein
MFDLLQNKTVIERKERRSLLQDKRGFALFVRDPELHFHNDPVPGDDFPITPGSRLFFRNWL